MAEFRTAADFGIVKRPPYSWRSQFGAPGLFSPSKEEAEAIRQRKEKERLIAEAQLRQQNASGLVANALAQEQQGPTLLQQPPAGPTQIQQPIVPGPSRTDQLNQAVLAKIQREGVGSDLPQQQVSAVSTPTAVDLTATQLAPETAALQAGRMGDTSLSQQALGIAPPVSNSDRLNQFSDEYLAKVGKRKKLLSGIAGLFGVTDRSDEYEKNALAKYTDYVDNQAAQIALEGGLPATKAEFIAKSLKAGASLDSTLEHAREYEYGPPEKDKPDNALLTSEIFTVGSRNKYKGSGDLADLEYVTSVSTGEDDLAGYKDKKQVRDVEATYRKEYIDLAKDFSRVTDAYGRILAARGLETGPGDIAIVFNYMKMLDPNSVVRESEYATAENAGGISRKIRNLWNRMLEGDRLETTVRQELLEATETLFREKDASQQRLIGQYNTLATQAGVDPTMVVLRYAPRVIEDGVEYILVGTHMIPAQELIDAEPLEM